MRKLSAVVLGCVLVLAGRSAADDKPVEVKAEQLAKDYKTDAAAADKKYRGKVLVVEGKVHDLYDKATFKEFSLVVWGWRQKELEVPTLVQCFFTKEQEEEASKQKKEATVKVKGKCEGLSATIFVVLRGCELVR